MNFKKRLFDAIQEKIDKEYRKNGLTDKVLRAQVKLNGLRNKCDVPDGSEMIYGEFVQ